MYYQLFTCLDHNDDLSNLYDIYIENHHDHSKYNDHFDKDYVVHMDPSEL
jgi:hypothetical protein